MAEWSVYPAGGQRQLLQHRWAAGEDWAVQLQRLGVFMAKRPWETPEFKGLEEFAVCRRAVTAYSSQTLERVIPPKTKDGPTLAKLREAWQSGTEPPAVAFAVEGDSSEDTTTAQWVRQAWQFDAALHWLLAQGPLLTEENLYKAHSIMLEHGVGSEDDRCDPGKVRTGPAMAGDYVFPEASTIGLHLDVALREFNVCRLELNPLFAAARLAARVVSVHPFTNGNGRMCRLLFAYGIMVKGFPWPALLSNGHTKSYKHYVEALKRVQQRTPSDYSHLFALALVSVTSIIANFTKYSKISI